MDSIWRTALLLAGKDALAALATEHDRLQAQRDQLNQERAVLAMESAAASERETMRNAALGRAQAQADELTRQLRSMQAALQQRESELESVRTSLGRAIETKDAAQREHYLAIQTRDTERRRQEARFAATERRHLEEVDRARQETKAVKKLLSDSEARAAAGRNAGEAHSKAANEQIQLRRTESTALRVSLAANEKHIHDLRKLVAVSRSAPSAKRPLRSKTST